MKSIGPTKHAIFKSLFVNSCISITWAFCVRFGAHNYLGFRDLGNPRVKKVVFKEIHPSSPVGPEGAPSKKGRFISKKKRSTLTKCVQFVEKIGSLWTY